jgi:hypothetical protein
VENLSSWGGERSIEIGAYPQQPAENITLKNVFVSANQGMTVTNANGVTLTDVNILPNSGKGRDIDPVVTIENCESVTISGARCFDDTQTYLLVKGERSRGITLNDNDLSRAVRAVTLGTGVSAEAVTVD